MCKIIGEVAAKGHVGDYNFRSYGKNNVDLLFNTLREAEAEHDKLVKNLKNVKISKPDLKGKKAYLVGFSDYHNVEGITNCINNKYGTALKLNSDNENCLKVLSLDPCTNNNNLYRATLLLSDNVLKIMNEKFDNKLRICYTTCTLYPHRPHKRCHKCQQHGHLKNECQETTPTCALCAGDHFTDQCSCNESPKCNNCFKSNDFKNQCETHSANSSQCPVFRAYRAQVKD